MKKYSLAAIIGGAVLSVASASANTSTFQFNTATPTWTNAGAFGDSALFSGSVANATVFAYSNATSSSTTGTTFQTAELGQSTGTAAVTGTNGSTTIPLGLTVCNQNETLNCGSPSHQVDNNTGYDFVLIEFSAAVNLNSLTLSTYQGTSPLGTDSQDFTYAYGTGAFPTIATGTSGTSVSTVMSATDHVTTVNCVTAGFNTKALDNCDTGASNTYTPTQGFGGNGVTWVMIGAQYPDAAGNDYFKISSLTVSTNSISATPEPATFGLIGLALAGLGVYGRRRKSGSR